MTIQYSQLDNFLFALTGEEGNEVDALVDKEEEEETKGMEEEE